MPITELEPTVQMGSPSQSIGQNASKEGIACKLIAIVNGGNDLVQFGQMRSGRVVLSFTL